MSLLYWTVAFLLAVNVAQFAQLRYGSRGQHKFCLLETARHKVLAADGRRQAARLETYRGRRSNCNACVNHADDFVPNGRCQQKKDTS